MTPLLINEFKKLVFREDTLILDVRNQIEFAEEHIPSSIFIGLDGLFEPWVELFIDQNKYSILLIIPEGRENETKEKLALINYTDNLKYLKGGFNSWKNSQLKTESIKSISAIELKAILNKKVINIYDVRKINEYNDGHLKDVVFSPLTELLQNLNNFRIKGKTSYIHCGGGYRSIIAASILKRNKIHNIVNITEGMSAIRKTSITII